MIFALDFVVHYRYMFWSTFVSLFVKYKPEQYCFFSLALFCFCLSFLTNQSFLNRMEFKDATESKSESRSSIDNAVPGFPGMREGKWDVKQASSPFKDSVVKSPTQVSVSHLQKFVLAYIYFSF